jgi:hypothetical protein
VAAAGAPQGPPESLGNKFASWAPPDLIDNKKLTWNVTFKPAAFPSTGFIIQRNTIEIDGTFFGGVRILAPDKPGWSTRGKVAVEQFFELWQITENKDGKKQIWAGFSSAGHNLTRFQKHDQATLSYPNYPGKEGDRIKRTVTCLDYFVPKLTKAELALFKIQPDVFPQAGEVLPTSATAPDALNGLRPFLRRTLSYDAVYGKRVEFSAEGSDYADEFEGKVWRGAQWPPPRN